jgi:hypothetical protein
MNAPFLPPSPLRRFLCFHPIYGVAGFSLRISTNSRSRFHLPTQIRVTVPLKRSSSIVLSCISDYLRVRAPDSSADRSLHWRPGNFSFRFSIWREIKGILEMRVVEDFGIYLYSVSSASSSIIRCAGVSHFIVKAALRWNDSVCPCRNWWLTIVKLFNMAESRFSVVSSQVKMRKDPAGPWGSRGSWMTLAFQRLGLPGWLSVLSKKRWWRESSIVSMLSNYRWMVMEICCDTAGPAAEPRMRSSKTDEALRIGAVYISDLFSYRRNCSCRSKVVMRYPFLPIYFIINGSSRCCW